MIPLLPGLRERLAGELRVETSTGLIDPHEGEFDAVLRLGGGPYAGVTSVVLAPSTVRWCVVRSGRVRCDRRWTPWSIR